jgi:pilus assembly protein CpaE
LLRQLATPHSSGLHLLAAPADAIEAAYIDDEIMSRILTLARRSYDYVIVDSFPMIDRVMMAVLDLSDQAYIVLESVVPTLLGGAKLLKLLEDLGVAGERIRIVLNRYMNFAGNLKPRDVAQLLGRPVDHVVPYKKAVVISANLGRPYILRTGRYFGFGRAITRIIDEVSGPSPPSRNGQPPAGSNGVASEHVQNNEAVS